MSKSSAGAETTTAPAAVVGGGGLKKGASSSPSKKRKLLFRLLPLFVHVLSVMLYLRPLTRPHPYNSDLVSSPRPVLDEAHIMTNDNKDVRGTAPLGEVWINDYWGRPMNSPSSHRSWRPLTVLSFRWLGRYLGRGGFGWSELFSHRLVNVLIHASVSELASILSVKLFFPSPTADPYSLPYILTRTLTKLLFAVHPTHVECTANAANRPHILSLLCSALASDPDVNIVIMGGAIAAGLLSSETAIFQLPGAVVTMTAIRWRRATAVSGGGAKENPLSTLLSTALALLPRYFLLVLLAATYLGGRYVYDTLSIPDGLIRPAENPYYSLVGLERIATYSLVLSSHVGKAFLIDPVGFSHEYGFDCVRKVTAPFVPWVGPLVEGGDPRLWIPIGLLLLVVVVTVECTLAGPAAVVMWGVMLSWLATLFPVSGFVKVGTSIADRIAVPSTLAVAVFGGRGLAWFLTDFGTKRISSSKDLKKGLDRRIIYAVKSAPVILLYLHFWVKVDKRASEWMDSAPLLESSLESCPRSAKSNLEISKIYSGLYPEKFDLGRALSYLEKAESIDPTYCDVHQQFAHCHIQETKYLKFEERLTKAVLCPFSMGGAVPMWQQYWQAVTKDPGPGGDAARKRMDMYQKRINEAVMKEQEKEEKERKERGGRMAGG
eukprot:CAMPEP_0113558774 /NCGR_PEP_ID=MMETSP0015_2-20120614/18533_1 /TAXON_ID=2838 /ORGANISM="Odontella" /LENGTH=660 /DNA_ID=CAMNT_0000460347 /DNA_START=112 /DNA_END=2090 /DNA_ORIENTATION=- /assembly_acc=CAM_ASM_000160